jgi:flagellar basal body P-ring protein FlgI
MPRIVPRSRWALGILAALAVLALVPFGIAAPPAKKKGKIELKIQETVGDLAYVVSNGEQKVEGVGLVVGLENTGADPPPSSYRQQLVDTMSKAGVEHADRLLANSQVSMVLVKLTIPLGVDPTDRIDVQVEVPPGCATKSLLGGYLMATRLKETATIKGTTHEGHELAVAQGPIMIGTPTRPNDQTVGRVLGGGRVKKDFPYTLVIKETRRSIKTSKLLETIVNSRFHQTEAGHQKGVATGKTEGYLVLKVPALYHQNQERYFRVLTLLPVFDQPELRAQRVAAWKMELLDPATAGVAALKLEGLGASSIPTLQEGLKSNDKDIKFFSAEALAYLNDPSGVEALAETVAHQAKFRPYALAALAAMDQPASHMTLRKLMDEPDREVRYGAFNALRTLDPRDPFLGQVRVLNEPKQESDDDEPAESMSLAIAARRRRVKQEDPFSLYVVDSEGPPLVHISRSRRSEIVIFGRQQKLLPPIVLDCGPILLNAAESDDKLEMTKIMTTKFGDADTKLTTSLRLDDIVRQAANLGASYPEIVTILEKAGKQKNLAGELIVDAVPMPNNNKYLEAILGSPAKRDKAIKRTSGESSSRPRWMRMFDFLDRDDDSEPSKTSTKPVARDSGLDSNPAKVPPPGAAADSSIGADSLPTLPGEAKISSALPATTPVKKDDAVQKAIDSTPPPRKRLLDFFKRSDES